MRTPYDDIRYSKNVFKKIETLDDLRENLRKRLALANKIKTQVRHSWVIAKELEVILHMLDQLPEVKQLNTGATRGY